MGATPLTVTFFRGLSAAGKSTLARELAAKTGAIRLNLDSLREMAGQPWSQENEKFLQSQQDEMALAALRSGRSVIVDNTHLVEKGPRRLATRIWEEGLSVGYDLIDVTVSSDECRHRNMVRRNSPTADDSLSVPDHVIVAQADLWAKEVRRGPWTIESIHRGLPEIVPYEIPSGEVYQRPTVLCDIDNTLALMVDRGPYDHDKCGGDELNHPVARTIAALRFNGHRIVLCSGRDSKHRGVTEDWLFRKDVTYDDLLMREEGDVRRDSVVKLELFDRHIRYTTRVTHVLDDRDRVVSVWRALGIPCFQVNPGNF